MEYDAAFQKNELDLYTQRVEKCPWSIASWKKEANYTVLCIIWSYFH